MEMNRLNINILVVCETRWANNADFICNSYGVIYADREKNKNRIRTRKRNRIRTRPIHDEMSFGIRSSSLRITGNYVVRDIILK